MSDYTRLVAEIYKAFSDRIAGHTRPQLEALYEQLTGHKWQRQREVQRNGQGVPIAKKKRPAIRPRRA